MKSILLFAFSILLTTCTSAPARAQEFAQVKYKKAVCSAYLACGIDTEDILHCGDWNMGSRGGSYQTISRAKVKEVALGRGWDSNQIKFLTAAGVTNMDRRREGENKTDPADTLFNGGPYGSGYSKDGQLVYFYKHRANGARYWLQFQNGKWEGSWSILETDGRDLTKVFPEFFEQLRQAKKIVANDYSICAIFNQANAKCLSTTSAMNGTEVKVFDIPGSGFRDVVTDFYQTYFLTENQVVNFHSGKNSVIHFGGIKKIAATSRVGFFMLMQDGSLKKLGPSEKGWVLVPVLKNLKFADIEAGLSESGELCGVDQNGRFLMSWPHDETFKELRFRKTPNGYLD